MSSQETGSTRLKVKTHGVGENDCETKNSGNEGRKQISRNNMSERSKYL